MSASLSDVRSQLSQEIKETKKILEENSQSLEKNRLMEEKEKKLNEELLQNIAVVMENAVNDMLKKKNKSRSHSRSRHSTSSGDGNAETLKNELKFTNKNKTLHEENENLKLILKGLQNKYHLSVDDSNGDDNNDNNSINSNNIHIENVVWENDEDHDKCMNQSCSKHFDLFNRKHHCRLCGKIFCNNCCQKYVSKSFLKNKLQMSRSSLTTNNNNDKKATYRVCESCV